MAANNPNSNFSSKVISIPKASISPPTSLLAFQPGCHRSRLLFPPLTQRHCAPSPPSYMVLASVAKYFSSVETPTPQLVGDDVGRRGSVDYEPELEMAADTRRTAEAVAEMEDFEAIRPPYLHVCLHGRLGWLEDGWLTRCAGNAGGRAWWDDGRHAHAFAGHGED